jgi:peroxiredoxin
MDFSTGSHYFRYFLYAVLVVLCVEVGFLIVQNRDLKKQLTGLTTPPETLKVGDKVEGFYAFAQTGDSIQVSFKNQSKPTMLWFFREGCPACTKNLDSWKSLYEQNQIKSRYNIISISIDSLETAKKYTVENSLAFQPLSIQKRQSVIEQYKVVGVPLTLIVDTESKVTDVYVGVLNENQKEKIFAQNQ